MMKRPEKPWTVQRVYGRLDKTVFVGLTRESLAAFKAADKAWLNERLSEILARRKQAFEVVKGLEASGLFHLKVGRTTLSTRVMEYYNGAHTPGEAYTALEETWLDEQEKAAHDACVQQSHMAYRDQAVCWLIARGKRYGTDFMAEGAIGLAEEMAFQEEIDRKKSSSLWYDFAGQNCDGPCAGWSTVDHRCQCGNRRVSWTQGVGHTFEHPEIFAEAY